jgi:hypothetical protein
LINLLNRNQLTRSLLNIITRTEFKSCKLSLNNDIEKIAAQLEINPSQICEQPMQTKIKIKHKFMIDSNLDLSKIDRISDLLVKFSRLNRARLKQETFIFNNLNVHIESS